MEDEISSTLLEFSGNLDLSDLTIDSLFQNGGTFQGPHDQLCHITYFHRSILSNEHTVWLSYVLE
jgi:hypothetical protein